MESGDKAVHEDDPRFDSVLETVRQVGTLGMEVCVTLGQLTEKAAHALKEAGVTAYNHNIDTSPEFYPNIVTTHTFQNRLETIGYVQKAGMSGILCGGVPWMSLFCQTVPCLFPMIMRVSFIASPTKRHEYPCWYPDKPVFGC